MFHLQAGLLVSFTHTTARSVCGASLLSPNRLVTAAHCWFDGTRQAWQFLVILGSKQLYSGGERIPTNNVIMHPQYFAPLLTNDVAMIYLPWNANINGELTFFVGIKNKGFGYLIISNSIAPSILLNLFPGYLFIQQIYRRFSSSLGLQL